MGEQDETEASRAERLREEIERLKRAAEQDNDEPARSPREFVDKRMRELEAEEDDA